eukprot:snap_masked-scaffold_2-processed-gene-0.34-mRNA-1 protein AED:1.00 eAED:1.00 QI:0/-1/0/0/-1/1/1/0/260
MGLTAAEKRAARRRERILKQGKDRLSVALGEKKEVLEKNDEKISWEEKRKKSIKESKSVERDQVLSNISKTTAETRIKDENEISVGNASVGNKEMKDVVPVNVDKPLLSDFLAAHMIRFFGAFLIAFFYASKLGFVVQTLDSGVKINEEIVYDEVEIQFEIEVNKGPAEKARDAALIYPMWILFVGQMFAFLLVGRIRNGLFLVSSSGVESQENFVLKMIISINKPLFDKAFLLLKIVNIIFEDICLALILFVLIKLFIS